MTNASPPAKPNPPANFGSVVGDAFGVAGGEATELFERSKQRSTTLRRLGGDGVEGRWSTTSGAFGFGPRDLVAAFGTGERDAPAAEGLAGGRM